MKAPKIRFKGFEGAWEEFKIKNLIIEYIEKTTKNNEFPVLSSTKSWIYFQTEYFNNQAASSDTTWYKRIPFWYFTYRSMSDTGSFTFNIQNIAKEWIVSPAYPVFSLKEWNDKIFFRNQVNTSLKIKNQILLFKEWGTRFALPFTKFSELKVINPKQEEQEKIWALFEQLDSHISKNQQKLEKLKNMKHSFLQKLFPKDWFALPELRFKGFEGDWEERKLGEIAECFSWGTPEANNPFYYWGNIPFIRSWEIHKNKTELYLTHLWLENSSAKIVSKWIILYALYWATSWEVNITKINWAINQAILAINPNKYYCSKFIVERLRKDKTKIIWTYLQGWQWNLSWDIVKKFTLKFPSLPEQEKIWAFFEKLDTQITQQTQKLEKLKNMKHSLLEKMFI